ncbi:hypothetical protein FBU59_001505 [Linderina macrospora]|uniref:Uncharacterized protein n=1 Tax=Linderina macrospora TaxID=4868 RepID=A0ACC1JE14_9FUNG|nr:hypothetical protein FBU59_001505 [Linderina macrospora]
MRQENRERKKRWRELNEERNKDNDLRCRVNKRANQLYGAQSTPAKEKWIVEEFERRQQRRKEKERRKMQQREGSEVVAIPTSFGEYSALPPHQVRAAYEFWKSAAEQHAMESSCGGEPREYVFRHYGPLSSAATTVVGSPKTAEGGLTLPPLSSVIPSSLMHAGAHVPASGAPTLAAPSRSESFASQMQLQQQSARHVRPWEEESLPDDDHLLPLANPDISRTPTLMAPQMMPAQLVPSASEKDLGGLAEAAFSLMSLSSSNVGDASPMP